MPTTVKPIAVTPTGPNGAASETLDAGVPFPCRLVAYEVIYAAGVPNTTVTVLKIRTPGGEKQIFSITGNSNVGIREVVEAPVDLTGVSVTGWYVPPFATGDLSVEVSISNAIKNAVTVICYLEAL